MDTVRIDKRVEAARKVFRAPGVSVAVVVGDEVYVQGYGEKVLGSKDRVTPDTLFAIGSTTKAFTTTAMAMLVDERKIRWDDLVRLHVPEFRLSDPLADALVTLRDLVCHRTGMPRHDMLWFMAPWGRAEVLRRFGFAKPTAAIRTLYQYNNICFAAAGEAVGRSSGMGSWETFVRRCLLDPLEMRATSFSTHDIDGTPDHAEAHRDPEYKRAVMPWRNLDNVGPAGSLNSNARDLAKWLQFLLAGGVAADGVRVVSEENLRETQTPQMVIRPTEEDKIAYPDTVQFSYGLGWRIQDYRGAQRLVSHGGAIGGFRAQVALLPEAKVGVAILTNMPSQLPEMLRNTLLDFLVGLPEKDWYEVGLGLSRKAEMARKTLADERETNRKRKTRPSRALEAYAGSYEDPAYGTIELVKEGSDLAMRWSGFDAKLKHWHYDSFITVADDPSFDKNDVSFGLGNDGGVESLLLFGVPFQRQKKTDTTAS